MDIRSLRPEEMLQIHSLYSLCFGSKPPEKWYENPEATMDEWKGDPEHTIATFDDRGRVSSAMSVIPYRMHMNGHIVGMSGIGGVVSHSEMRRQGNVRRLFDHAFAVMRERGDEWSYLYPFSHAFYARMGYAQVLNTDIYTIPTKSLSSFEYEGTWERVEAHNVQEARAVYEAFVPRYNFLVMRDEKSFLELYADKVYAKQCFPYLYRAPDGTCRAVVRFARVVQDGKDAIRVRDVAWLDDEAFLAIPALLSGQSAHYENTTMELPRDMDMLALLVEPYDAKRESRKAGQARIVDAKAALSHLPAPEGRKGGVTLRVSDPQIADNDGCWRVEYDGQGVEARRVDAVNADAEVTINMLSQLVSGYLPVDALARRADLRILSQRDELRALFPQRMGLVQDYF